MENECPICGEIGGHTCLNCDNDISEKTCRDNQGYCNECAVREARGR